MYDLKSTSKSCLAMQLGAAVYLGTMEILKYKAGILFVPWMDIWMERSHGSLQVGRQSLPLAFQLQDGSDKQAPLFGPISMSEGKENVFSLGDFKIVSFFNMTKC